MAKKKHDDKAERVQRAHGTLSLADQIKAKAGIRPDGQGRSVYNREGAPPPGDFTNVPLGGHNS